MSDEHDIRESTAGFFTDIGEAVNVPPTWVIRDLLPTGIGFCAGPPKDSQKSTLVMAICTLVAGYKCHALPPFMSAVVNGGPILAFSAEATAGELRHMCEEGMGVKVEADGGMLIADDPFAWRLDDPDGLEKLLFWLKERDPRVCVIDPLRDFHQMEEKDSGNMNRLLRPLQQWAKQHDSAVIVVHHTRKKGGDDDSKAGQATYTADDMRGTSALFGIADFVWMLSPRGDGKIHMKATFKRAAGWERTFRMATYDHKDVPAAEIMGRLDEEVLKMIRLGESENLDNIAKQLGCGKAKVVESCDRLYRNGLLTRSGRKWKAVPVLKVAGPPSRKVG